MDIAHNSVNFNIGDRLRTKGKGYKPIWDIYIYDNPELIKGMIWDQEEKS